MISDFTFSRDWGTLWLQLWEPFGIIQGIIKCTPPNWQQVMFVPVSLDQVDRRFSPRRAERDHMDILDDGLSLSIEFEGRR